MTKKFFVLAALMAFLFHFQIVQAFAPSPDWVKNLPAAKSVNQLVIFAQLGEKTTAWISMHEKINGEWNELMTTPGFIGKEGLGKTKEGDNKTPVGTFHFTDAFGILPDPGCRLPYLKVDENIYWSGDVNYKYNKMVDIREYEKLNKADSEFIISYVPYYNYCLNISYNEEGTAKGSAIFMHCFGTHKPWTGGCVSLPETKMLQVMQNVRQDCVVVIDSLENLGGKF